MFGIGVFDLFGLSVVGRSGAHVFESSVLSVSPTIL